MTDKQLLKFAKAFREGVLGGQSSRMMCAAVDHVIINPALREWLAR